MCDEIAAALKKDIYVIPVLVNGAQLPLESELPTEISELVKYQSHDLRHAHFGRDILPMIAAIKTLRQPAAGAGGASRATITLFAVMAALVLGLASWYFIPRTLEKAEIRNFSVSSESVLAQASVTETANQLKRDEAAAGIKRKAEEAARSEAVARVKAEEQHLAAVAIEEAKRKAESDAAAAEAKRKLEEQALFEKQAKAKAEEQRIAMLAADNAKREVDAAAAALEAQQRARDEEEAKAKAATQPGRTFQDNGCPGGCPVMVVLPSGAYLRGSPSTEAQRQSNEGPQDTVTIAYQFAVAKYEITRDQFDTFVSATGREVATKCKQDAGKDYILKPGSYRSPGYVQSGSHPVVCVSWNDAIAYAGWLTNISGYHYRLLTEAEWEFAARGVTEAVRQPRFPFGDDEKKLCDFANGNDLSAKAKFGWTDSYSCRDGQVFTASVGSYKPNAFGLYDMIGNAWEFVQDCFYDDYSGALLDGTANEDASKPCDRAIRGGAWNSGPAVLRSAKRDWLNVDERVADVGFRVARAL